MQRTFLSRLRLLGLLCGIGALVGSGAHAQTLFLSPVSQAGHIGDLFTYDLNVTGGIGSAVGWGTDVRIDPTLLQFVADFAGVGKPFLNAQPYFDLEFDNALSPDGATLHLNFLNLSSLDPFGVNGPVTLGQFRVRVLSNAAPAANLDLSAIGIPPDGSAVQDIDGINLLTGTAGAQITFSSSSAPEPGAAVLYGLGLATLLVVCRRRARATVQAGR